MRYTCFKRSELFQYVICHSDYSERAVARFSHQIQSEYYGGNRSVSIDRIALEYFSALPKADINSTTQSFQLHAAFHSFSYYGIKQYAATTTVHSNRFIALLKEKIIDNIF